MIGYAVTAKNARQCGIAREAYISAIMQVATESEQEGKELLLAGGEATYTSEEFWNSVGWKRVYAERDDAPRLYEEIRYVQPALDYDLATGDVAEGANSKPEHLMLDIFEAPAPDRECLLATVRAFYDWCNCWPREAFETETAYEKHAAHVHYIWNAFKSEVLGTNTLAVLDKKMRAEMQAEGIVIIGHDAADQRCFP